MRSSTRMTDCEQVTDPLANHGEGVIWDAPAGLVRWVDMLEGDILATAPDGQSVSRLNVGKVAAAIRPRAEGGLVVAVERGFALLDPDSDAPRDLGELWSDVGIRMNDGACDPQGRFYCGSMAYDAAEGRGALYRLDPDGSVAQVLTRVTISNGLAWSRDGTIVYYVDSATQRIDAFDHDPERGQLHNRRPVVTIPAAVGTPDGMTLDAEGFLWVAMWGGSAVHRYSPTGRLDGTIKLPARQVTSCAFGGPALDELYVTTSRLGLDSGEDPLAGALFRCRPGVQGLAPYPFAS